MLFTHENNIHCFNIPQRNITYLCETPKIINNLHVLITPTSKIIFNSMTIQQFYSDKTVYN
jgi:hypothetical protein